MEWAIDFSNQHVVLNEQYETVVTFTMTIICQNKVYVKTLEFKDCVFEVENNETRQQVVDFMDKKTIRDTVEIGESVHRTLWCGDVGIMYTLHPYYEFISINIISTYEHITPDIPDADQFWAFFYKFCKVGEFYLHVINVTTA